MNNVTLIGRLTREVELRTVREGLKVASLSVAVPRPARGGHKASVDFVPVTVWSKQAESCANGLIKGQKLAVNGRLRFSSWDQDGQRRTKIEVVATGVEFLERPASASRPSGRPAAPTHREPTHA